MMVSEKTRQDICISKIQVNFPQDDFILPLFNIAASQVAQLIKTTTTTKIHLPTQEDVGDAGLINESGSSPGVENGNQLHCSCLENAKDRGAYLWTGLQSMGLQIVKHD